MGTGKAADILRELAATYLAEEANRDALITVTRAEFAPDGKRATVYVSVFPESREEDAIWFLTRHGTSFRDYLKKRSKFRALPFVEFRIDIGEKNRQRLEELPIDPLPD